MTIMAKSEHSQLKPDLMRLVASLFMTVFMLGAGPNSTTKPVAVLQPDELKVVEKLGNDILLTYFFATRENGNINYWSGPQRREVIREEAQYAQSTKTIYRYPSPSAILKVQNNRIIWKNPNNVPNVKLSVPMTLNIYSFALKAPISRSSATIIDGISREVTLHSAEYVPRTGKHYRLAKVLVDIMEGTTAPDGSKLHEISLFPLTVSIE
jgi:hypothetical protein